ncbi:MAG: ROK family protein, partial [Clostridia bacterium]|nr:ROK family protein [Clostridia bacterium]
MLYAGIDLGGTNIKGGLYRGGKVLIKDEIKTGSTDAESVIKNIAVIINRMLNCIGLETKDIAAIGAGIPGMIESSSGTVLYNNNLGWV